MAKNKAITNIAEFINDTVVNVKAKNGVWYHLFFSFMSKEGKIYVRNISVIPRKESGK